MRMRLTVFYVCKERNLCVNIKINEFACIRLPSPADSARDVTAVDLLAAAVAVAAQQVHCTWFQEVVAKRLSSILRINKNKQY